jgi:hypothetical protein
MGVALNIKCLFANLSASCLGGNVSSACLCSMNATKWGPALNGPSCRTNMHLAHKRLQLHQILPYVNSETLLDRYCMLNRIFHALDFCLVCCGMFSLICSVLPPNSAFPPVILLPCTTLPFSFTSLMVFLPNSCNPSTNLLSVF